MLQFYHSGGCKKNRSLRLASSTKQVGDQPRLWKSTSGKARYEWYEYIGYKRIGGNNEARNIKGRLGWGNEKRKLGELVWKSNILWFIKLHIFKMNLNEGTLHVWTIKHPEATGYWRKIPVPDVEWLPMDCWSRRPLRPPIQLQTMLLPLISH